MDVPEESSTFNEVPTKSRRGLFVVGALVVVIIAASVAAYFVLVVNKPKDSTTASAMPEVPTKKEVGQIMTSVDDEIKQANTDQAAASAALNEAATPIQVNL
jgi:flagellar basal body-associated protein FliL